MPCALAQAHAETANHLPSNTSVAHPVRYTLSSSHSTRWVPPGETTSTSLEAPPCAAAATAAPQAPVPDAGVGPTPRSQIRMRTRLGLSIRAKETFVR